MRFIFKTDYEQDIRLAKHGGQVFWYGALLLLLLAAPWLFAEYWLAQLTFVLIYSHRRPGADAAGRLHRPVLARPCRLPRRGRLHPGGADQRRLALPARAGLAAGLSAAVGVVVGLPALRVKGIYLGIATLSFGFIVEEVLARWESVTGGNAGIRIKPARIFGWTLDSGDGFYFLCLALAVAGHAGDPEPAALAHRPRLRRHPRFGNLGAEHGHPPGALQDPVVRAVGRARRHRRRAVRAQAAVHLARPVQHPAVDRPAADDRDRRPGFGARRLPGRDLPDHDAAGDRADQGLPAAGDRPGARPAGRGLRRWC